MGLSLALVPSFQQDSRKPIQSSLCYPGDNPTKQASDQPTDKWIWVTFNLLVEVIETRTLSACNSDGQRWLRSPRKQSVIQLKCCYNIVPCNTDTLIFWKHFTHTWLQAIPFRYTHYLFFKTLFGHKKTTWCCVNMDNTSRVSITAFQSVEISSWHH